MNKIYTFLFRPAIRHPNLLLQWRLNSFYLLVSGTMLCIVFPVLTAWIFLRWGEMTAVAACLVLVLCGQLFFVRRCRLVFSVSLYLATISAATLYFILLTHITEAAFIFPFLVIFAGVFVGVRLALLCSVVVALALGWLSFALQTPTSLQIRALLQGQPIVPCRETTLLISVLALTILGVLISILYKKYVLGLIETLSTKNKLLQEAVSRRERAEAEVRELNSRLKHKVQESTRQLRKSEEELRQSEKMRVLGQLAGGIAHDFNNQLTGIIACADMIRSQTKDNLTINGHAQTIMASARQASQLTQQLLAFARKGKYQSVPLDIHQVLIEVLALLERSLDKNILLTLTLKAEHSVVIGDSGQFHNALLNIALNARDAMPAGGEISFATSNRTLNAQTRQQLNISGHADTFICITISDTGTGIAAEYREKIFEPFFTTKPQGSGTGMGLAAVYGTVRNHGGAVRFETSVGTGTTFEIFLPLTDKPLAELAIADSHLPASAQTAKGQLLLIDDEETVRVSLARLLRHSGYSVADFSEGKSAVEWFCHNHQTTDLIILDMIMPVVDGYETFLLLSEYRSDTPLLLVSGYAMENKARSILSRANARFVQKPFEPRQIIELVAAMIQQEAPSGDK